ncbi:MAG: hypothetical protein A2Z72_02845 [Omnitrophica bacterium RBG_13_46_9]|nr:MAG: hypothetical protein A2Z72_02845 [Omnitrophica bacterium RBG_13_46_9]
MEIAILGAGLAGLELGRRIKESGKDFFMLEKENQIGGLCRTNKTGEYYWDFAVHAMYSRHKDIMDYFYSLPLVYEYLNRNVKIFHTGSDGKRYIIDYPFEIGIKNMPLKDKLECVKGYIAAQRKRKKKHTHLKDWVDNSLGAGIAKHFMIPYNKKIWNCGLSDISDKLVTTKIDPNSTIDFILSILGKKVIGREYQAKFLYPKQGIQKLIDYTARDIKDDIMINADVKKLIRSRKKWVIMAGKGMEKKADLVISTIPLPELLKKIEIAGLKKKYDVFRWNNTFFVMVGLKKEYNFKLIKDCQWVFFKEREVFYRITLMHNFSSEYMPSLVAEITQKGDILEKSKRNIKDLVVRDLIRLGIIGSASQIARTDIKLVKYTYPIPTVGLGRVKENVSNVLKSNNIFLCGRNGNWDYINMDGVILNAQKFVAENL